MKFESIRRILGEHIEALEEKERRIKKYHMDQWDIACLDSYKYFIKLMGAREEMGIDQIPPPHQTPYRYK